MSNSPTRKTNPWIETKQLEEVTKKTGNIYKSVVIMAARSKQIASKLKEEISQKLEEFSSTIDTLEEVHENQEQIEISKYYERLPQPVLQAMDEFMNDDTYYRFVSEDETEENAESESE